MAAIVLIKRSRQKQAERHERFARLVDERMAVLSPDWKPSSAAAARASIAVGAHRGELGTSPSPSQRQGAARGDDEDDDDEGGGRGGVDETAKVGRIRRLFTHRPQRDDKSRAQKNSGVHRPTQPIGTAAPKSPQPASFPSAKLAPSGDMTPGEQPHRAASPLPPAATKASSFPGMDMPYDPSADQQVPQMTPMSPVPLTPSSTSVTKNPFRRSGIAGPTSNNPFRRSTSSNGGESGGSGS